MWKENCKIWTDLPREHFHQGSCPASTATHCSTFEGRIAEESESNFVTAPDSKLTLGNSNFLINNNNTIFKILLQIITNILLRQCLENWLMNKVIFKTKLWLWCKPTKLRKHKVKRECQSQLCISWLQLLCTSLPFQRAFYWVSAPYLCQLRYSKKNISKFSQLKSLTVFRGRNGYAFGQDMLNTRRWTNGLITVLRT